MSRRTFKSSSPPASASSACVALQVVTAHTVVTHVQPHDNAPLELAPIPAFCDLRAASLLTGLSRAHIRQLLKRHKQHFDARIVQAINRPGRPTTRWPKRILTAKDVQTLRDWYPIYYRVK